MCIAVGGPDNAGRARLFAERWNGHEWSLQGTPLPNGTKTSGLNDVSCITARDCVAVGYFDHKALAEGWNGRSWSLQRVPRPRGTSDSPLYGVSCLTHNFCFAIGGWSDSTNENRYPLLERWNGSSWSLQRGPPAPISYADLRDISCTSTARCMAVGVDSGGSASEAIVDGWDGLRWSVLQGNGELVGNASLYRVSCPSRTFCAATGYVNDTSSGGDFPDYALTEIWNGKSWQTRSQSDPRGTGNYDLVGVSCASPTACLAVGNVADRWNGRRWSLTRIPVRNDWLLGVDCRSRKSCEAVGAVIRDGQEVPLAVHWSG